MVQRPARTTARRSYRLVGPLAAAFAVEVSTQMRRYVPHVSIAVVHGILDVAMVLTVIAAAACGWLAVARHRRFEREAFREALDLT